MNHIARTAAVGLFVVVGCSKGADSARQSGSVAGAPAEARRAAPPAKNAWPAEVRDIEASLDAFESVTRCRDDLASRMPTEVAEALTDIGYSNVFDDVCTGLAALKTRDVRQCDALAVSPLRKGCRRRLAFLVHDAALCPKDPVLGGREPLCVAWATRDAGLCRAVHEDDRGLCEAGLAGEPDACRKAPPASHASCRATVERYGDVLEGGTGRSEAATAKPSFEIVVDGAKLQNGKSWTIRRSVLDRGIFLGAKGCAFELNLADPVGEHASPVSFLDRPATASMTLRLPALTKVPATLPLVAPNAVLGVTLPGIAEVDTTSGGSGTVELAAFRPERGALVRGEIRASLLVSGQTVPVRGSFETFVRDVDALPASCGPR